MSTAREPLQEKIYEVAGITSSMHEDAVDGGLLTFNLIRNKSKQPHNEALSNHYSLTNQRHH